MAVLPGIVASANVGGRQYALPALTTANQNSAYVFSTAATTTLGSVTVTKRTGGGGGGGTSQNWADPGYNSTNNSMTFNGTNQAIAYKPNSQLQIAPLPFSFQVDFYTTKTTGNQYIVNLGQGNSVGWPCFQVMIMNGGNIELKQATTNDGSNQLAWTFATVVANKWYRLGVMYYRVGTSNYVRVYLNGEIKLQVLLGTSATNASGQGGIPRAVDTTGTAGLAFGSDNANTANYNFQGEMRNIFFDNEVQFWPI